MSKQKTTTSKAKSAASPVGKSKVLKKVKKTVTDAQMHIKADFNNTIVTITDAQGNTLSWSSAAHAGFKGSRKSTGYAAQIASLNALESALRYSIKNLDILVKGPGPGRESAIRAISDLKNKGIDIVVKTIKDVTPVPQNGVRARKPRRV